MKMPMATGRSPHDFPGEHSMLDIHRLLDASTCLGFSAEVAGGLAPAVDGAALLLDGAECRQPN